MTNFVELIDKVNLFLLLATLPMQYHKITNALREKGSSQVTDNMKRSFELPKKYQSEP